jgi:hypothetical protein
MVVSIVRFRGSRDVGTRIRSRIQATNLKRPEKLMGALIGAGNFSKEKGTTPESGGEVRIPIDPGRDTPTVDPPLPNFTTPTPVHDGELILPATWLPA